MGCVPEPAVDRRGLPPPHPREYLGSKDGNGSDPVAGGVERGGRLMPIQVPAMI
jgi:hypothetical protein